MNVIKLYIIKKIKYTIEKIGELGLRVDSSLQTIVTILKGLINRGVDFIVSESLCVLRDLSRKYPALIDEFLKFFDICIQNINNDPKNIRFINIWGNQISDISILSSFPYLEKINLNSNQIEDISAFKNLTNIRELSLKDNIYIITRYLIYFS